MILHKETIKKFGYSPKDRSQGYSTRLFVCKCDRCGKIFDRCYSVIHKAENRDIILPMTCRPCGMHNGKEKYKSTMQDKIWKQLNILPPFDITPKFWWEMFNSYCPKRNNGRFSVHLGRNEGNR